jgi:pimeloyl-ACP methyl ester carboxylesterase
MLVCGAAVKPLGSRGVTERVVESLAVREWGDPTRPGVLLWPGLGSTGAYYESLVAELPLRAVAVDPPGHGGSAGLEPCTFERLLEMAGAVVQECGCVAVVGHSLGACVAVGLACAPPDGLRSAVLLDGGFMEAKEMAAYGMPITEGRAALAKWLADGVLTFSSWDDAVREVGALMKCEESDAFAAYVHDVLIEVDGEVRERVTPERAADLILATFDHDARALAKELTIPTLLLASGEPAEQRVPRQAAWEEFASASPLVKLHVEDGWAHNPIFQQPAVLASMIASWIGPGPPG